MKDYRLNQALINFLTSNRGRLAVRQILDGDQNAIDDIAKSFFDTYGMSEKATQAARDTVVSMAKRVDIDGAKRGGFNTKAKQQNSQRKQDKDDITTEAGKEKYTAKMKALKKLLLRDPKIMAANIAGHIATDAALRPTANLIKNNANKLAEAILAAARTGSTDRGRDLFGSSPRETGAQVAALNHVRRGENISGYINGLANAADSILGDVNANDDYARQMAAMHTLADMDDRTPNSGMYNFMNGENKRAQQRARWASEGRR